MNYLYRLSGYMFFENVNVKALLKPIVAFDNFKKDQNY